ncbi:uncharacterized protein LOC124152568 [Haliotis rufescens]|uniref:uncharacterized protein LOC124152568 n=1 Tax=Haliotis rufescens TaxID=6454 RepID=UPI00201F9870|nr:uncharacterized protein LOC124152568 [Haliotis rufescens]
MALSDESFHLIYIWMPLGVRQVGHAALDLSNRQYVSWWPKEDKVKCGLKEKKNRCSDNLQDDIKDEGRDPDYTFKILSTALDLDKMITWWTKQKSTGHYSFLNQNCCWVVYQVLHAGGAPKSLTILWRPETLRRYLDIYLGGGPSFTTLLNMPFSDLPFKEKMTFYRWEAQAGSEREFELSLDNSVVVASRKKIRRPPDFTYSIPYTNLKYHLMRRRWKEMQGAKEHALSCFESKIREILLAGGMSEVTLLTMMDVFFKKPDNINTRSLKVKKPWIDLNYRA